MIFNIKFKEYGWQEPAEVVSKLSCPAGLRLLVSSLAYSLTLNMEAVCSSKTSGFL
jgi:hypothetical protein